MINLIRGHRVTVNCTEADTAKKNHFIALSYVRMTSVWHTGVSVCHTEVIRYVCQRYDKNSFRVPKTCCQIRSNVLKTLIDGVKTCSNILNPKNHVVALSYVRIIVAMQSGPAGAGRRCLICDISYIENKVLIVSSPEQELLYHGS